MMARANDFWNRRAITIMVSAIVVMLLIGLYTVAVSKKNHDRAEENAQRIAAVEVENDQLGAALDTQIEASVEGGVDQVVPDSEEIREATPDELPVQGEPGHTPTNAELRALITQVLLDNPNLTRTQIIAEVTRQVQANLPEDGADATDAQVALRVAEYCLSRDECRGPGGTNGLDGRGIANSFINDAGHLMVVYTDANGVAEDLGQVVGSDGATGDVGPPGKDSTVPGPKGDRGISVVSSVCTPVEDGSGAYVWINTFSEGPPQEGGPCTPCPEGYEAVQAEVLVEGETPGLSETVTASVCKLIE